MQIQDIIQFQEITYAYSWPMAGCQSVWLNKSSFMHPWRFNRTVHENCLITSFQYYVDRIYNDFTDSYYITLLHNCTKKPLIHLV